MSDDIEVTIKLSADAVKHLRNYYGASNSLSLQRWRRDHRSTNHVNALVLDALPKPIQVGDWVSLRSEDYRRVVRYIENGYASFWNEDLQALGSAPLEYLTRVDEGTER